jgi:hypothetical protein
MEMEKCTALSIGDWRWKMIVDRDWVRFTAMSGGEAMYDVFAEGHI